MSVSRISGASSDDAERSPLLRPARRPARRVEFSVFRSKGASELSVAQAVEKRLAELSQRYPDVTLSKIDDAVAYTRGNYEAAMTTLIAGAILAR